LLSPTRLHILIGGRVAFEKRHHHYQFSVSPNEVRLFQLDQSPREGPPIPGQIGQRIRLPQTQDAKLIRMRTDPEVEQKLRGFRVERSKVIPRAGEDGSVLTQDPLPIRVAHLSASLGRRSAWFSSQRSRSSASKINTLPTL
jgi:hypothetical protein